MCSNDIFGLIINPYESIKQALINKDFEFAQRLLERIDINDDSNILIDILIVHRIDDINVIRFILENGFDVDLQDKNGITSLMAICFTFDYNYKLKHVFLEMAQYSTNLRLEDNRGFTVFDMLLDSYNLPRSLKRWIRRNEFL